MSDVTARLSHPGGALAVIRLATIPFLLVAEALVDHPGTASGAFAPLITGASIYAVAAFAIEWRGAPPRFVGICAGVDLLVVTSLVLTSGGPFSQLRLALPLLPLSAAFLLRPRLTAAVSAACVAAYLLVAAVYPERETVREDWIGFELTQALFLVLTGAVATLVSALLAQHARRIEELAASRQRLVADALDAEDHARRRLAEGLHDEALQNLLAARQLLAFGDAESTALARAGLDEAVGQIRDAVFDLHPYLLEQAGLEAALKAVAEKAVARTGTQVEVHVAAGAQGVRDHLVFAIARELVANVVKHADARRAQVDVARADGRLRLVVADDGVGLDPARHAHATRGGHIGLASCAERAEAVGGGLATEPGLAGRGTAVVVDLGAVSIDGPLADHADRAGEPPDPPMRHTDGSETLDRSPAIPGGTR